ncbi:transforming growth factor beta receptor type 3-like [Hetaerina americana]|uniref:transforming growth factor beta receptor type 3-like n=1 Tax=Hetaerina americana TaxID=62018 RepID=UPI003A7F498F
MGMELLLLPLIPCVMAFHWFLFLCMAPSISAEASDPVLCVVQSPLETPYFTPWLTLPRPALGCSSPYRLRIEDKATMEVHVLHLVHFGDGADKENESQASFPTTHEATRHQRSANKRNNRKSKHKLNSASNSHLPPVDMTMNGLWWDWSGADDGTPATLPPPISLSTLVLVLFSDYPIKWRLHALALPQTSKLIIQVTEDSVVESNFPVQTLSANWSNKTELLQYVHSHYDAITSFTEVNGANQIDLKVGYATAGFKECNTNSSKKSSVVSASLAVKQKTEGCFHENYIGYNPWDVYVVELNPNLRRKSGRDWEGDSSDGDAIGGSSTTSPYPTLHPVAVLLEGEGPVPVPRNVTLVLKSGSPIRWRFGASGVDGSIVVVSNQEVENWGAAAAVASIAGGMGTGKSTFGFKRSGGLEVKSRTLPDNMDALLEQVASEFGRPVLYAKTASASTLKLLVGNGRHTKFPATSPPSMNGQGHSTHPDPWSSASSSSLLGIEPSSEKSGKGNSHGEEDSSLSAIATLQKAMRVICERKKIVVSFPRHITDSLGVAWMSFIDSTCSSKVNSTHIWLSTLITSCRSTSKSDGRSTSFSNSVYVKFGPPGSDDEDFAGPGDDGEDGSEFGSGSDASETDLMEESSNHIPVVCRQPPLFPGSGFGPMDFGDPSLTDTVEMSSSSVSEHNKLYHMEIYWDRDHRVSVDFGRDKPAEVAFDETLYVKAWIDGSFPIQVVTENCWISNSSDPNYVPRVTLIRNTCPTDLSVAIDDPSRNPKSRKSPHGRFSFQVSHEYGNLGNIYVHCRLGVCASDAEKAKGNLVMCVEPHKYCSVHSLHAFLNQAVSSAQQLSSRGPLHPVPKRLGGKLESEAGRGMGSTGRQDSTRQHSPSYNGVPGDITDEDVISAIAGGALSPINQGMPQQVLVVGISTEVAIGIAVVSFAIGVGLTISLWCIHIHTDPFRSRRRSNKHLVQVVGVPGGTNSILCEGGGSPGGEAVVAGVGMAGGGEGCNLSPRSGCSTTNSQATIAA